MNALSRILTLVVLATAAGRVSAQVAVSPQLARVTLEEIGVRTSFGLQERDRFLAVLSRPLDAAFLGGGWPSWFESLKADRGLSRPTTSSTSHAR
jgi:hypothetical protein